MDVSSSHGNVRVVHADVLDDMNGMGYGDVPEDRYTSKWGGAW